MTTAAEVMALKAAHPDWTSGQLARRLGCQSSYVRATIARARGYIPPGLRAKMRRAPEQREEHERARDRRDLAIIDDLGTGLSQQNIARKHAVSQTHVSSLAIAWREAS